MKNRLSFFLLLCVPFLDYAGMGLVFPLFAFLLFDPSIPILDPATTPAIRGMWMGILISLAPLMQFFFSPILGSLSDQRGRKPMILLGLGVGGVGYLIGIFGVHFHSMLLLILYRVFFGISSATMTVVQASLVDISSSQTKARNFGLYNMALGTGFSFGPFLGSRLSDSSVVSWFNFSTPFMMGLLLSALNFALLFWTFSETRVPSEKTSLEVFRGIKQVKAAFSNPKMRITFFAFFLFVFGWDFFTEFVSVTLKVSYSYTKSQIGNFFAYMGVIYAFGVGMFIQPVVKRYSMPKLLAVAMLVSGIYLFGFSWVQNPSIFWFYMPPLIYSMAIFFPVASTYVSDNAPMKAQGEILGVYHSVQAMALVLSPLFTGSLAGRIPMMPIYLGSFLMVVGGCVFSLNLLQTQDKKI